MMHWFLQVLGLEVKVLGRVGKDDGYLWVAITGRRWKMPDARWRS